MSSVDSELFLSFGRLESLFAFAVIGWVISDRFCILLSNDETCDKTWIEEMHT